MGACVCVYVLKTVSTAATTTITTATTACLLYTSDAADDRRRVDLGGRRIN